MVRSDAIHRLSNRALDLVLFHLLDSVDEAIIAKRALAPRELSHQLSDALSRKKHSDVITLKVVFHLLGALDDSIKVNRVLTARELSSTLSRESYSDVITFRLLDRRFNDIYKLRFYPRSPILSMPRRALDTLLIYLLGTEGTKFSTIKPDGYPPYLGVSSEDLSSCLLPNDLRNIINFRLVNNGFNNTYKLRFSPKPPMLRLPPELFNMILSYHVHINTDGRIMPTEKKASLSVESFALHPPSPEDTDRAANFRLVCRQIAESALLCQFTRVAIRFSDRGFEKLQFVATRRHLAKTVRQLSYMIPRFYSHDSKRIEEILEETKVISRELQLQLHDRRQSKDNIQRPTIGQLESRLAKSEEYEQQITKAIIKAQQQRQIIDKREDFKGLFFALATFENLEQIRFMKIVDQADETWAKFLESHPEYVSNNAAEFRSFEWNLACEHSAKILTEALIKSKSRNLNRLSSRFIDPRTPLNVTAELGSAISNIARRLNSLELEFDNRMNLDEKVQELSELFHMLFTEAVNLQNLHVGFRKLLSVPIRIVFHDIELKNLRYLGLHLWELESGELIDFLLRYRHIKYLRLRYIRLKRGSWVQVLKAIRLNLTLSWVSLRGVDYPPNPELGGLHFGPAPFGHNPDDTDEDSDSDDGWDGSGDEVTDATEAEEAEGLEQQWAGENEEPEDYNDASGHLEDGDGSDNNESVLGHASQVGSPIDSTILPNNLSPDTQLTRRPSNPGSCYCYSGYAWDSLIHTRALVRPEHWKRWQEWVLKPCKIHDPDSARNDIDSDSDSDSTT